MKLSELHYFLFPIMFIVCLFHGLISNMLVCLMAILRGKPVDDLFSFFSFMQALD